MSLHKCPMPPVISRHPTWHGHPLARSRTRAPPIAARAQRNIPYVLCKHWKFSERSNCEFHRYEMNCQTQARRSAQNGIAGNKDGNAFPRAISPIGGTNLCTSVHGPFPDTTGRQDAVACGTPKATARFSSRCPPPRPLAATAQPAALAKASPAEYPRSLGTGGRAA